MYAEVWRLCYQAPGQLYNWSTDGGELLVIDGIFCRNRIVYTVYHLYVPNCISKASSQNIRITS